MAKPFSEIHNTDAKLSKQVRQSLKITQGTRKALTWRVVDIAVGAAVGVMSGVMFWVFDGLSYGLFPLLTLILPGSAALLHALFYFPATLGSLIVRKPGASAYVLLVASFVEVVLGTKYSVSLIVIALVQAAAAEAVFALFRYRRWTLGVTILSALSVGIVYNFYLLFFYYQAFSFFSDYGHPLSETDQEKNCGGTDLTMVTMGEPFATTETAAVFSYAISAGSKDPAKAMQMLNLIETNTDMMNLLNWGVEGEDYIVNEDGLLDYPEGKDATTVGYHLGAGWILPNQFVCTPWVDDGPDVYEKGEEYNKTAIASKALGFNFNPEPVADQIAGITNVKNKYYKALIVGAVDPDEYLPKMIEEMNAAGMQEIIAESQRQLDEFLAAK